LENTLIRKLFAGASFAAVAAVALLLVTVGQGSAKPAEATPANIGATIHFLTDGTYALIQVNAQDNFWDFPNSSDDVEVTASAGDFVLDSPIIPGFDPLGCTDQLGSPDSPICQVDSNGFGDDGLDGDFDDSLAGPGDTHIEVCNDQGFCNNNTSHLELWWLAPEGFDGGNVTFTAEQDGVFVSTTLVVRGAPATINLVAIRDYTNEGSSCAGTPVYVIAAVEYTFNNPTTFNNNRAILCADVRDNNNTPLPDTTVVWSVTGGGCLDDPVATNTEGNGLTHNRLESCSTGNSGDIATVTATAGTATDSVQVQFGGDPASCSIPEISSLDIGDTAHFVATFLDANGNWVPDGIVGHLVEVDSGDGADNVQLVSVFEDTVKGAIEGDVIGAISGLTTIAASV